MFHTKTDGLKKCVTKKNVSKMRVIMKRVLLDFILSLRVGHESSSTIAQYVVLQKKLIE
jgi:hypothetical protein